jgi:hypothetical protein
MTTAPPARSSGVDRPHEAWYATAQHLSRRVEAAEAERNSWAVYLADGLADGTTVGPSRADMYLYHRARRVLEYRRIAWWAHHQAWSAAIAAGGAR